MNEPMQNAQRDYVPLTKALTECAYSRDSLSKALLMRKGVLADLLMHALDEYRGLTREEVAALIEPEHNRPSLDAKITGRNTESWLHGKSKTVKDVVFNALLPGSKAAARIIVNVEAQASQGSDLYESGRQLLYAANLISDQVSAEVQRQRYDELCKTFSIWLYTNPRQCDEYQMHRYGIAEFSQGKPVAPSPGGHEALNIITVSLGPESARLPEAAQWMLRHTLIFAKSRDKRQLEQDVRYFGIDSDNDAEMEKHMKDFEYWSSEARRIGSELEARGEA
ncbi:MAG: hypothetical protein HUK26_02020, partial [Duodenibacillus sp.]|nr:hypothetical protein [Duodenibacillus sp.]